MNSKHTKRKIAMSLLFWGFVFLIVLCASPILVLANDENGIRFGPIGEGTASGGAVDREFIRNWESNPPLGYPTLSPTNVAPTQKAIKKYQEIVANGGWETVPETKLAYGQTDNAVPILKSRLMVTEEYEDKSQSSAYFDSDLENALKKFQATNGLTPTGVLDERTVLALNVPAQSRLRQLRSSLGRLQNYISSTQKQKYVVVNIPAAQVEAVEGNKVISRHTAVVGKPERPTPIMTTTIQEMNFNPVWHLPPTVVTKDLIPRGREMQNAGKNVLLKFGIDAFDSTGKKVDPNKIAWDTKEPFGLTYKQKPGKENPLGFLKINFNSDQSVYMHDTPSETIFGRNFRAASSGCIRIKNIDKLAVWLLAGNPGWKESRIEAVKDNGKRLDVKLKKPVTLYFVYMTAWATPDGIIQFRRDIYDRDGAGPDVSAY